MIIDSESTIMGNMPDHDRVVIDQWPKEDDPKERRIVKAIKDQLLSAAWARDIFRQTAEIQLEHLKISLQHLDEPQFTHDNTQKVLERLAELTYSKIVAGEKYLNMLSKGEPILLLTNHLGVYKLNSWPIEELKEKTGLTGPVQPVFYPCPLYFSAMYPIARALDNNLYIASFEYPGLLGKIFRATGSIEVPPKDDLSQGKNRTEVLIDSTRRLVEANHNAVIVSFPEGGTTGKRNGGGPYDLESFHTGSYVIAASLGLPILPVAQYFDPNRGFELRIFEPLTLETNADRDKLERSAKQHCQEELEWLQERVSVNS